MKNKTPLKQKCGLYLEGLRQSRVIGLPFACLAALLLVFDIVEALGYVGLSDRYFEPSEGFSIIFYGSFCAATPLMLLMLFHFLNSRSASDFYHAIPQPRPALYFSFAAAALTWTVGAASLMLLAEGIFCSIIGNIYPGDWFAVWLGIVSTNALCAGGVLLAISISSTVFSQVIITGLILFLPRVLFHLFEAVVTALAPVLPSFEEAIGILGAGRINVIFGYILYDMEGPAKWIAPIYSLLLAGVYALLGMVFFGRRKSETAASPALNRWVQTAVRVIVAFAVCLIPTTELINDIARGDVGFDALVLYAVLYVLALIVYFVYEALSNRSVKGMAQSWRELLVGLAVLVGLNVAFAAGAYICSSAVLSFAPEDDEVVSISIPVQNYRHADYDELVLGETEITDRAIIELLAGGLRDSTDDIDLIRRRQTYHSEDNPYEYTETVCFTLASGRRAVRNVYIRRGGSELLEKMLRSNSDYVNAASAIPTPEEVDSYRIFGDFSCDIPTEVLQQAYECYYAEVQTLDKLDFIYAMGGGLFTLEVSGKYNGHEYESDLPVNLRTPETLTLLMEYLTAKESFAEAWARAGESAYYDLGVYGYNFENSGVYFASYYQQITSDFYADKEYTEYTVSSNRPMTASTESYLTGFFDVEGNLERLVAELTASDGKPVDVNRPFYHVSLTMHIPVQEPGGATYYDYVGYDFFLPAAEENSCLEDPAFVDLDMVAVG